MSDNTTVTFYKPSEIPDAQLKFAVIAARLGGSWIYCRHKARTTWEIPGGHREPNEDILDTAKRELYEETGASDFDITPVSVYSVGRGDAVTYGLLCYAEVKTLGALPPELEIGEIGLYEIAPGNQTYPAIQPRLYKYIQDWLNMRCNPDERWDVYDADRRPTGKTHRRGDPLDSGEYHLVVYVWVMNSSGEFLLTKRTPNKGNPNMWENTGGSALAGDDSLSAALREVKEETGLTLLPENGECVMTFRRNDAFHDVWLFKQDFDLDNISFQENETCGAMTAGKEKVLDLRARGLLVPISYLDELFDKIL